ncbi:hypothetical protein [Spirosoma sp. KNUC1025]|uniref:hypothetical protein n=1 Tax=Spirosoma sp. KNUC1025 TaxID=2894082 RepID=UPI00386DA127|nr:hypothetical protein LN737_20660 [Spirosoma sp. KNUC1025]
MRKTLLVYLVCHCWLCQAQNQPQLSTPFNSPKPFNRKDWLFGFQVGYSKNSYLHERYSATQAYGGYFVANKLALGLSASWSRESFIAAHDATFSVGPLLRYQFTRSRVSPFIVGAYQWGQATVSSTNTKTFPMAENQRSIQSGYAGLGTSIRVVAEWRVDLLLTWQDKPAAPESGIQGRYHLLQAQIGANYLINRKR